MVVMEKLLYIAVVLIFNSLVPTCGWRVVFKVLAGTSLTPHNSLYDLWLSSGTVRDNYNDYKAVRDDLAGSNPPVYKSGIVNSWQPIRQIKVALYDNDTNSELMSIVFNNTAFSNKLTWFEPNNLAANQKYTDLSPGNVNNCSIEGDSGRRFQILSDNSTQCGQTAGWLVIIDRDSSGQCTWDQGGTTPFFRYSTGSTATQLTNSGVADVFLVFVDECADRPCNHGGTCVDDQGSAVCTCPDQYYGYICEYVCPCSPGKCLRVTPGSKPPVDNPVFTLGGDTLVCSCRTGFGGRYCGSNIDDCASTPCENGGTCKDGIAEFICECPVGYYGKTCSGKENDGRSSKVGANVAVAIIVPITVLLVGAVVGYCIYIKRNPQGYGRATTYKHMAIARDFVRRSIRRMSGRRSRPGRENQGETTKDNRQIISKKATADTSQVNLGFQGGYDSGMPDTEGSRDAEYIDLKPHDQAVMSEYNRKPPGIRGITQHKEYLAPKAANSRADADYHQKSSHYPDSSSLGSSRSGSLHQDLPPINPHYSEPDTSSRYTPDSAGSFDRDTPDENMMYRDNRARNQPSHRQGSHPQPQSPHPKDTNIQSPHPHDTHTHRTHPQGPPPQSPGYEDRPVRPSRRPHQNRQQSKPSDMEYI